MNEADRHGSALDGSAGAMDHRLERLIFFSDAVFAIAITLLVIEIEVPRLPFGTPAPAYWQALANLWPSFLAFVLSFLVIGRFWIGHHQAMSVARGFSVRVVWANMFVLMAIAFMPFVTAFLAKNMGAGVPAILYCGAMAVIGLLNLNLERSMGRAGLIDADGPEARDMKAGSVAVVLGAVVAMGIAFLLPPASPMGLVTIFLWHRLLGRRESKKYLKSVPQGTDDRT